MKVNEVILEAPDLTADRAKFKAEMEKRATKVAPMMTGRILRDIYDAMVKVDQDLSRDKIYQIIADRFVRSTRADLEVNHPLKSTLTKLAYKLAPIQKTILSDEEVKPMVNKEIYDALLQALTGKRGKRQSRDITDLLTQSIADAVFSEVAEAAPQQAGANITPNRLAEILQKIVFDPYGKASSQFSKEIQQMATLAQKTAKPVFIQNSKKVVSGILDKLNAGVPEAARDKLIKKVVANTKKVHKVAKATKDERKMTVQALKLQKNHIIAQELDIPKDATIAIKVQKKWHFGIMDHGMFRIGTPMTPEQVTQLGLESSTNLQDFRVKRDLEYPKILTRIT